MFISFLERLLRVDVRYVASGGIFLSLTSVVSALTGFLLTVAFANFISQETFGIYRYVLSVYSLLALIALPGIDTALTRTASRGERGAYLAATYAKISWGFLGTLAGGGIALWYGLHGNHTLAILFLLAGAAVPLIESVGLYNSFLYGLRRFRLSSMLEMGVHLFSTAALCITLYLSDDILLIVTIYFFSTGALRALAFFMTLPLDRGIKNFSKKELFDYGKHLTFYEIAGRGVMALDSVILWHFLGPTAVALFALATAIPVRIQSFLKISGTLAFPKFADRSASEIAHALPRKMFFFGIGILIIAIIYALFAKSFFSLFFPAYLSAVPYTQVLIFYTLSSVTYPFWSFLMANKKLREIYTITGINFIIKTIILMVCVPLFGVWGAVASYLGYSLTTIVSIFFLMRRARISGA